MNVSLWNTTVRPEGVTATTHRSYISKVRDLTPHFHPPGMHVLVCEDDASVRVVLGRMLERLGCRVTQAENGDDALAKYLIDPADVVLTDMVMPEKDGVETIKAFRKQYPEVRVVAMSGGAMAGAVLYLKLAINLGASAVLPKPFSVEELTRALGIPYLH